MDQTTTAIYENGLLRPAVSLDLPEHSEVEITIHTSEDTFRERVRKALGLKERQKIENPISDERRAELAKIFTGEVPLADYIREDRDAR